MPWISSFAFVKPDSKDGKKKNLRIFLDPSNLNKVVQREPFCYRSPEDIYYKLSKAAWFALGDFKKSYWQVSLNMTVPI